VEKLDKKESVKEYKEMRNKHGNYSLFHAVFKYVKLLLKSV
jgi:hypothetical protein